MYDHVGPGRKARPALGQGADIIESERNERDEREGEGVSNQEGECHGSSMFRGHTMCLPRNKLTIRGEKCNSFFGTHAFFRGPRRQLASYRYVTTVQ